MPHSKPLEPSLANYNLAVKYLNQGKLVSFPTETVYGLGADATNDAAVASIFEAKRRPSFNPLIIHLPSLAHVELYAELDIVSRKLAARFWPGPFTLVLNKKADSPLSELVSAGLDTVAVRVPEHVVAHTLLEKFGRPIAAPSANISGKLSPTTAQHVAEAFGQEVATILDGGPCRNGIESTIVQVCGDEVRLLRPGSVTKREIEQVTGLHVSVYEDAQNPTAPGQLKSHYAPNARLRLNATELYPSEALLAFGSNIPKLHHNPTLNLSPKGSLHEAASNLFAMLHELDALGLESIAVSPIPAQGLGRAINDRLKRAATPSQEI